MFIIGGGGTAAPLYRAFTKKDIGVYSGIIHENDIDFEIGRTMGINMCIERPFNNISAEHFEEAKNNLKYSKIVIDTGFRVGEINKKNTELIKEALVGKKKVYSFRSKEECSKFYKDLSDEILYVNKIAEIINDI